MKQARCKHCDRPVEWIEVVETDGTLKKVALDPKAPIYHFDHERHQWVRSVAMVSHFWVCPVLKQQTKSTALKSSMPDEPWWTK